MSPVLQVEILVLGMLLVVSLVAVVTRRFRVPYTAALVVAGLVLSLGKQLDIGITPQLILSLFLPPLVFEAAFHLPLRDLRRDGVTIFLLAVPGVLLAMAIVGGALNFFGGLSLPLALVFGALIAATDPVTVLAIFRRLGVPKRLEVLLEAESLFNDGTAIVLFNLALAGALSGAFHIWEGVFDFLWVSAGGLAIGLALGWITAQLLARVDDYLVETTLTTVVAFGSYLLAEQLHVSGVLAVLAAGLVTGSLGTRGMSPTTRIVVFNFWEYAAFLANSAVFLLIGLLIDLPLLAESWQLILLAIASVLVSRAIATYLTTRYVARFPLRWSHAVFWGGPRGAIALALALSLPASLGESRSMLLALTFGVVLFTILVQSLTTEGLLRHLKVIERSEARLEYERRHARALAARAGYEHLQRMHRDGLITTPTWDRLRRPTRERLEALTTAVREAMAGAPEMEIQELSMARREALRAQRAMLGRLRREGILSDESHADLIAEVDLSLETQAEALAEEAVNGGRPMPVRVLLFIVVQDRDLDRATNALSAYGAMCTRLKSQGGFLGQSSHLLLVGLGDDKLEGALSLLEKTCRTRVEYVMGPLESVPGPMPAPIPVEIRGATVFAFNVERHEEIRP
jgi:CPA1 family monovalent cation:H+ antiporter